MQKCSWLHSPSRVDLIEHKRWFQEQSSTRELPPECSEPLPATYYPYGTSVHAWKFRWVIEFPDNKYIQMRERWKKVMGLQESRREMFAYHYGTIVSRGVDGLPESRSDDPVDLRIDNAGSPVHLHYGAQEPHHTQDQVRGLVLNDVKIVDFLDAVLRHREDGRPLHKVLGFKV
jgi:hypothetical protein